MHSLCHTHKQVYPADVVLIAAAQQGRAEGEMVDQKRGEKGEEMLTHCLANDRRDLGVH